jgi:pimeloyl-ACP methyl ester carboxylesterase
MALTTFADGRLWGVRHGDGRPWVLALHGWRRDHRDFDAVLSGLDAIALDLPGHGAAPEPPASFSTAEYAAWVAPVIQEMAAPVVVLGHSFGGRVALHLGASLPGQVGALVITGTPLAPDPARPKTRPPARFVLGRRLHAAHLLSDARMERLRQRYGSADYRAADPLMRGVLVKAVTETAQGGYLPLLANFAGPVELVWGADDDQAPVGGMRLAAERRPDATVTVLDGVGHFTPRHGVEALRQALLRHRPIGADRP